MSEKIKTIGKDYTLWELMKFATPAVLNEFMINCLYTVDDGLFITRYVGTNAESAFSILMPLFMMHGAISALLGGVAVLVARKMGEKKDEEARGDFTAVLITSISIGVLIGAFEFLFKEQLLKLMGATEIILPYAKSFLSVSCFYVPLTMAGNLFARFYVPAGSPKMELFSTMMNVGSNLFFDWYFVVYRRIGMIGTAYANLIATTIQVSIGVLFYSSKKAETGFGRPSGNILALIAESCRYGISTFLANTAVGLGYAISNRTLIYFGDEGYLAAYTIVNNIGFTFMSGYFGLFGATGPLLSYAVGERNKEKLRKLFRMTATLTTMLIVLTIFMFFGFSGFLAELFTGEAAADIKDIIHYGLDLQPYGFLFFGYNIGIRMSMTSLGNVRASTIITIMQEVVFSNLTVVLLPMIFGIKGVWYSFMAGNALTFILSLLVVYLNRDNYGYGKSRIALLID
ncbi:MAG: hypothetical protein II712_03635 [Erysipelotrichaceae bacterium]|nr:hypothetical protein [Erysipelotrichaceae bacterium]